MRYRHDDFQWIESHDGRRLECLDAEDCLFSVQIDAGGVGPMVKVALLQAYFTGLEAGKKSGRDALLDKMCDALTTPRPQAVAGGEAKPVAWAWRNDEAKPWNFSAEDPHEWAKIRRGKPRHIRPLGDLPPPEGDVQKLRDAVVKWARLRTEFQAKPDNRGWEGLADLADAERELAALSPDQTPSEVGEKKPAREIVPSGRSET